MDCVGRLLSATWVLWPHLPARGRPTPKVVAQSLVDNARTATPPLPAVDERGATPPTGTDSRTVTPACPDDMGAGGALRDVGTSDSPRVIDVNPISTRPGGMEEDLVKDQAQIDQAPKGPGTSGA
jgi:hypothetical protein